MKYRLYRTFHCRNTIFFLVQITTTSEESTVCQTDLSRYQMRKNQRGSERGRNNESETEKERENERENERERERKRRKWERERDLEKKRKREIYLIDLTRSCFTIKKN